MSVALKEGLLLEILPRKEQKRKNAMSSRFCFGSCCNTVEPFQSGPCWHRNERPIYGEV